MSNGIKTYFRLLQHFIWQYRWIFLLGIIGTALASGLAVGFIWFLKPIINKGFVAQNVVFIHWLPFIIIAVYFSLGATSFLGDYCIALVARRIVMDMQRKVFRKYLEFPDEYLQDNPASKLLSTLTYNIEQVTTACTSAFMTILRDGIYIPALIVVMFLNSWQLASIFVVTLPFLILIIFIASRRMQLSSLKIQDKMAYMTHIAKDSMQELVTMRVNSSLSEQKIDEFCAATEVIRKQQIDVVVINSLSSAFCRVVASVALALAVYLATARYFHISVGAFVSTISAMLSTFKPIRNVTKVNIGLQKGIAGAKSVFAILDE